MNNRMKFNILALLLIVSGALFAQQNQLDAYKQAFKGRRFVVISKQSMELYLYEKDGLLLKTYPMACGKAFGDKRKVGDMRTPEGVFKVQQIQDASTWTHDFKDGKGVIKGCYGSHFIRLKTPGHSGIGIHGTHDPNSIGTRATEGCIRLNNKDLLDFVKYVVVGMPVVILTSDKDIAENAKYETRVTKDVTF